MSDDRDSSSSSSAVADDILAGKLSIDDIIGYLTLSNGRKDMNSAIAVGEGGKKVYDAAPSVEMAPIDYNVEHVSHVHPPGYKNADLSATVCDLVVIGAGVGGLLSVIFGNALGMKCILVEEHYMGGDCLNVGCFPSKALLACAKRASIVKRSQTCSEGTQESGDAETAEKRAKMAAPADADGALDVRHLGVSVAPGSGIVTVDFDHIMKRMRKLRSDIAPIDSVARYKRDFCHEILLGKATFLSPNTLSVKGQIVTFKKAMIATGTSAFLPPIRGLVPSVTKQREGVPSSQTYLPHLTNNTIFDLQSLPTTMAVIGSGPIGCEMAQAFQRFGCRVAMFEVHEHILAREDREASEVVEGQFRKEGISLHLSTSVEEITISKEGNLFQAPFHTYTVTFKNNATGATEEMTVESVLVSTGRVPNVMGIGLENANVEFDTRRGVAVDEFFQTSNPNIYACGDVCSAFKFTHAADWSARLAIRNMYLGNVSSSRSLIIPWCTYTDPEIAHVGKYEHDLDKEHVAYEVLKRELHHVDRCKCEGELDGFVKVLVRQGTDEILGATIVAEAAGDMISELTLAMQYNIGAAKIAGVMHPYPTRQEAVRQCCAQANKVFKNETATSVVEELKRRKQRSDTSSSSSNSD